MPGLRNANRIARAECRASSDVPEARFNFFRGARGRLPGWRPDIWRSLHRLPSL